MQGRRLSSLTKGTSNSATSISYDYDMSGIRSSKTVDGVTHSYVTQSGKVVRETYGTVTLEFFYDANGRPFALEYADSDSTNTNTGKFYYVLNAQGDVVGLLNESGTLVVKYTYDAWGKLLSVTDASGTEIVDEDHIAKINPLRYRGYYYDAETGWYYLQSRYYDPIVKRFLSADSFASTGLGFIGYNMFTYCINNPVNCSDLSGYRPAWEHVSSNGLVEYTDSGTGTIVADKPSEIPASNYTADTFIVGMTGLAAFGAAATGSVGIAFDKYGNIAFIYSVGGGGGFPSASLGGYVTSTTAPSVDALEGASFQVGGSFGEIVTVGGEGTLLFDNSGITYYGATFFAGAGLQIPLELHSDVTYTEILYEFNIFDVLQDAFSSLFGG